MNDNKINQFLSQDNERLGQLIEENPVNIPINAVAAFLGADSASVRATIENNTFGAAWKKVGSTRRAYFVPTAQFVRWYLNV